MKFYDKHISMNKWQGRENLGKQKQTRIGTLKAQDNIAHRKQTSSMVMQNRPLNALRHDW